MEDVFASEGFPINMFYTLYLKTQKRREVISSYVYFLYTNNPWQWLVIVKPIMYIKLAIF